PTRSVAATLVLDTGATTSSLNATVLRFVGYDPDAATEFVSMTTGTHVERVPRLMVNRLSALGRHAIGLRVLAHDLPAVAAVDGLLGSMGKGAKPDIRVRFGFAVKDRREALRLTQEEFAELAGIHRTYLSDIERGTRNLSLVNIERVASALSLKISELFQFVERS